MPDDRLIASAKIEEESPGSKGDGSC